MREVAGPQAYNKSPILLAFWPNHSRPVLTACECPVCTIEHQIRADKHAAGDHTLWLAFDCDQGLERRWNRRNYVLGPIEWAIGFFRIYYLNQTRCHAHSQKQQADPAGQ